MMLTQKYTSIISCKHLVPSGTKCCHGINYKSNHNLVCGYYILSILICHSDHKNTTLLCQFFFFLGDLCCSLVACFRAPLPRILCLSSNRSLMTTPCMKNPTAVLCLFFQGKSYRTQKLRNLHHDKEHVLISNTHDERKVILPTTSIGVMIFVASQKKHRQTAPWLCDAVNIQP